MFPDFHCLSGALERITATDIVEGLAFSDLQRAGIQSVEELPTLQATLTFSSSTRFNLPQGYLFPSALAFPTYLHFLRVSGLVTDNDSSGVNVVEAERVFQEYAEMRLVSGMRGDEELELGWWVREYRGSGSKEQVKSRSMELWKHRE